MARVTYPPTIIAAIAWLLMIAAVVTSALNDGPMLDVSTCALTLWPLGYAACLGFSAVALRMANQPVGTYWPRWMTAYFRFFGVGTRQLRSMDFRKSIALAFPYIVAIQGLLMGVTILLLAAAGDSVEVSVTQ